MQKQKEVGVGIVGWGFIGKVHTYGYINLPLFYQPPPTQIHLVGVCTAHGEQQKLPEKEAVFNMPLLPMKNF